MRDLSMLPVSRLSSAPSNSIEMPEMLSPRALASRYSKVQRLISCIFRSGLSSYYSLRGPLALFQFTLAKVLPSGVQDPTEPGQIVHTSLD